MTPTRQGSFRLFQLWGIDVHIHWSWFIVGMYSVQSRVANYESPIWGLFEYLALFLIVLMHEFGHAMACRQVGGEANQIVLWPLGGVAYVSPPQRPGATLWSIAAGPLVNVVLFPILLGCLYLVGSLGMAERYPDLYRFLDAVLYVDVILLVFNLMPVYPLDGGQILRSILWYPLGKARSLTAATVVGFIGGLAMVGLAIWLRSIWIGIMTLFLLSNCWQSFQAAKALRKIEKLPRRTEFACPECHTAPPRGNFWLCASCRQAFDPFVAAGTCPHCQTVQDITPCPDCGSARGHRVWDASIRDV